MSYILDALRRAESERERGLVPGVHTQPAPSDAQAGAGHSRRVLLLAATALGLLLLGALAARWLAPSPATTPAPLAPPVAVTRAAPPLPAPELVRLPPPSVPAVVAAPASRPAPPVALNALPEALRRQLPPLQTGGAMYSETPSKRMLIINGQLYQEGAQIAAGLVLEQIKLNSAVLAFQGQRFSISY